MREGRLCDDPLKIVSHGRPDGSTEAGEADFSTALNSASSPYTDSYPTRPVKEKHPES